MVIQILTLAFVLLIRDGAGSWNGGVVGASRGNACMAGDAEEDLLGGKLLQIGATMRRPQATGIGDVEALGSPSVNRSSVGADGRHTQKAAGPGAAKKVAVASKPSATKLGGQKVSFSSSKKAAVGKQRALSQRLRRKVSRLLRKTRLQALKDMPEVSDAKRSAAEREWRAWLQRSANVDGKAKQKGKPSSKSSAQKGKGKSKPTAAKNAKNKKAGGSSAKEAESVKKQKSLKGPKTAASVEMSAKKTKMSGKATPKNKAKASEVTLPEKVAAKEKAAAKTAAKGKADSGSKLVSKADSKKIKAKPSVPAKGSHLAAKSVKQKTEPAKQKAALKGKKEVDSKASAKKEKGKDASGSKAKNKKKEVELASAGKAKKTKTQQASKQGQLGKVKAKAKSKTQLAIKSHAAAKQKAAATKTKKKKAKKEKSDNKAAGTLLNPVIGSVIILMSAPAGLLLLAFGAFLWVKSQEDVEMGAEAS